MTVLVDKRARAAVDAIIRDMCGRSGGDWWWEPIDKETQREIKKTWRELIEKAYVNKS